MSYGGFSSVKMMVSSLKKALGDLGVSSEFKETDGNQLNEEIVYEDAPVFTYTI
jgi:hypothetical protein